MKSIFPLGIFFLLAPTVLAETLEGSAERGKEISAYCVGCHGETGISPVDSNPNLAGQKVKYLEYALRAYRSRERAGGMAPVMYVNAGHLSDQDIKDVALYFSMQQP